jgi:hypothetical protein
MRISRDLPWLCFCAIVLAASVGTAFAQQDSGGYSNDQYSSHHSSATYADTGLYVGAGFVRAQVNNVFGQGYHFDINHNAWQAILGFRPVPVFAAEADYIDLGSESHGLLGGQSPYGHADARAFGLFGVGFLPVGPVDLYAKAGGARWELSGSLTGPGGSLLALNRNGVSFAWGAGIQAHIGPIGARLGYEHFQMPRTDGARLYNLSVLFTF